MIKIVNFKLVLTVFTIIITMGILLIGPTLVQSQTPTPEEEVASEVTEPVDEEIKQKVQERIEGVKQKNTKKAFWGTLIEIANSTLTVQTPQGERRVKTDEETTIINTAKKELESSDLAIDNFLIIMGFEDENQTMNAKRIIALNKAPKPTPKRYAVYGDVTDISEEEDVLSITHPQKATIAHEVEIDSKTLMTKKIDGEIEKISFSKIEVGDRVIAVGTKEGENGTITATLLRIIPMEREEETTEDEVTPTPEKEEEETTPTPEEE